MAVADPNFQELLWNTQVMLGRLQTAHEQSLAKARRGSGLKAVHYKDDLRRAGAELCPVVPADPGHSAGVSAMPVLKETEVSVPEDLYVPGEREPVDLTILLKPNENPRVSSSSTEAYSDVETIEGRHASNSSELGSKDKDITCLPSTFVVTSSPTTSIIKDVRHTAQSMTGRRNSLVYSLRLPLKLRDVWSISPEQEETTDLLIVQSATQNNGAFMRRNIASMDLNSLVSASTFKGMHLIASPGANWRLCWDLSGAFLIAYDTIAIPFGLSFQLPDTGFLSSMDWVTTIFWTIDVVLTFFVGYMEKGQLERRPRRVIWRYLTTWFLLDVVVVVGGWFYNVGLGGQESYEGMGRMVRSLRAIRILRLLRLLKLRKLLADLQDHISSEYTYLLLNLCKLLMFILFLNHGIACLWYWLGRKGHEDGDPSWVEENNMLRRDLGYRYTTSMHWTLTQFTPASMEVFPQNTAERTMSVIVLMFALVAFSSFVGSISTSMTALRNMNADTNKQFWMLRRYLKQQKVPKVVSTRILKYLEYIVERKQGKVQQQSIKILSLLSQQLREELTYELTKPNLAEYELFHYLSFFPVVDCTVRRLCATAIKMEMVAGGDVLFYTGDEAPRCYCFITGDVEYVHDDIKQGILTLEANEWPCEAALWMSWRHTGKMSARAESELLTVDVAIFAEETGKSLSTWTLMAKFAKHFVSLFFEMDIELTDVIKDEIFREALGSLVKQLRVTTTSSAPGA